MAVNEMNFELDVDLILLLNSTSECSSESSVCGNPQRC